MKDNTALLNRILIIGGIAIFLISALLVIALSQ